MQAVALVSQQFQLYFLLCSVRKQPKKSFRLRVQNKLLSVIEDKDSFIEVVVVVVVIVLVVVVAVAVAL